MLKRWAFGLVILIIILGVIFITLDILDIGENFRLVLPINILNAVFILVIAIFVAYMSTKSFTITGLPEILCLGCAVLVFGVGNLFRGWIDFSGNTVITVEDSTAFIASATHLIGLSIASVKRPVLSIEIKRRLVIVISCYIGILAAVALITFLAVRDITPLFMISGEGTTAISYIIRTIAALFFLVSSLVSFRIYIKSHKDFYYWYSLGLMLLTLGVIFISQGAAETRIAWLGRASIYLGGIYFLYVVFEASRISKAY